MKQLYVDVDYSLLYISLPSQNRVQENIGVRLFLPDRETYLSPVLSFAQTLNTRALDLGALIKFQGVNSRE